MNYVNTKKQDKFFELPLRLYDDGIKKVKLRLLELHPEFDCIINQVYNTLWTKKEISLKTQNRLL